MWIARDKNKDLYLYLIKPTRNREGKIWGAPIPSIHRLSTASFEDLQWENEPLEVEVVKKETMEDRIEKWIRDLEFRGEMP